MTLLRNIFKVFSLSVSLLTTEEILEQLIKSPTRVIDSTQPLLDVTF